MPAPPATSGTVGTTGTIGTFFRCGTKGTIGTVGTFLTVGTVRNEKNERNESPKKAFRSYRFTCGYCGVALPMSPLRHSPLARPVPPPPHAWEANVTYRSGLPRLRDCEAEARPADETAEAEQGQRSAFCKPAATGAAKTGHRNRGPQGRRGPVTKRTMGTKCQF